MNRIEERLMKYIPKQIRQYVVWLDSEKQYGKQFTYFLTFEKDGKEFSAEPSDSVSELAWNAKNMIPYISGEKEWIE